MANIKEIIENIVNTEGDFSMSRLFAASWPHIESATRVAGITPELKKRFGETYKKLAQAVLRNAFLIELVKIPKIETTKFRVRWFEQLNGDPRWCSFEECFQICLDLLLALPAWLRNDRHGESLNLFFDCGLIPYEVPIDYYQRTGQGGRLHEPKNIGWVYDDLILRTLKLRNYLTDAGTSPDASFFKKVLTEKIKVKTYLTDRVLTGDYKTNREKRWETHPQSVHFAERRTCMAIEFALVTQICAFDGVPTAFLSQLKKEKILPDKLPTALCPITGDALSYQEFRNELLNPTHGKADFQVGHLNPLKHDVAKKEGVGHNADNISWISADGNRIQGSLSLKDVRSLIRRISENYNRHGW